MAPYFVRTSHDTHVETQETLFRGRAVLPPVSKTPVGHSTTRKFRVVCRACNNGWMSSVEVAAKPMLLAALAGTDMTIDAAQQKALTDWLVMKAIVYESETPRTAITTDEERRKFMDDRSISDSVEIILLKATDEIWNAQFQRTSGRWSNPAPLTADPKAKRNICAVTFGIGSLVAYIFDNRSTYHRDFDFGADREVNLWPNRGAQVHWPPPVGVNSSEIVDIVGILKQVLDGRRYAFRR